MILISMVSYHLIIFPSAIWVVGLPKNHLTDLICVGMFISCMYLIVPRAAKPCAIDHPDSFNNLD
jgi:hypothetical protein